MHAESFPVLGIIDDFFRSDRDDLWLKDQDVFHCRRFVSCRIEIVNRLQNCPLKPQCTDWITSAVKKEFSWVNRSHKTLRLSYDSSLQPQSAARITFTLTA